MQVRVGGSHDSVIKSNCVTVRWGGEQLAMNDQSVGDEPDSAGCCGEPACVGRSLKITGHVAMAENDGWAHQVVGDGMTGSLCEINRETCPGVRAGAGVRAFVVPQGRREVQGQPARETGSKRAGRESSEPKHREAAGQARDNTTRAEGREAGKWMSEIQTEYREVYCSVGNG